MDNLHLTFYARNIHLISVYIFYPWSMTELGGVCALTVDREGEMGEYAESENIICRICLCRKNSAHIVEAYVI